MPAFRKTGAFFALSYFLARYGLKSPAAAATLPDLQITVGTFLGFGPGFFDAGYVKRKTNG